MTWIEWLVLALSILGTINLVLMRIVARKEKKAWDLRMEEIEKRYTAGLCESGARFARAKMRSRAVRRLLERMLGLIE